MKLTLVPALPVRSPAQVGINAMNNPFPMTDNWGELPEAALKAAYIGTIPTGKGGTWLCHRSAPSIIGLDSSGKTVKAYGDAMSVQAHGFCMDNNGNQRAGDSGPFGDDPSHWLPIGVVLAPGVVFGQGVVCSGAPAQPKRLLPEGMTPPRIEYSDIAPQTGQPHELGARLARCDLPFQVRGSRRDRNRIFSATDAPSRQGYQTNRTKRAGLASVSEPNPRLRPQAGSGYRTCQ